MNSETSLESCVAARELRKETQKQPEILNLAGLQSLKELLRARLARFNRAGPKSCLEPIYFYLAELRYRGHSVRSMHEFARQAGFDVGYSAVYSWVRQHIGTESGSGSRAESILLRAAKDGAYTPESTPELRRQAVEHGVDGTEREVEFSRARKLPSPGETVVPTIQEPSPVPAPDPRALLKEQRIAALQAGLREMEGDSPFKRIMERQSHDQVEVR